MGEQGRRKKREKEERTGLDKMGGGGNGPGKRVGLAGPLIFFLVCYILPSFKEFVPEFNYSKVYQLDKLKLTALKELWVLLAHLVLELPSRFTLRLITP